MNADERGSDVRQATSTAQIRAGRGLRRDWPRTDCEVAKVRSHPQMRYSQNGQDLERRTDSATPRRVHRLFSTLPRRTPPKPLALICSAFIRVIRSCPRSPHRTPPKPLALICSAFIRVIRSCPRSPHRTPPKPLALICSAFIRVIRSCPRSPHRIPPKPLPPSDPRSNLFAIPPSGFKVARHLVLPVCISPRSPSGHRYFSFSMAAKYSRLASVPMNSSEMPCRKNYCTRISRAKS